MCCKETNTIKAKLFRLILSIVLAMLIFGANSINASAGEGHCRNASCKCQDHMIFSCIGTTCWFDSMSHHCSGHSFTKSNKETTQTGSVSRTCTRDGKAYYSWVQYYRCTMSGCSRQHERGESDTYDVTTAYASGHNWSNWYYLDGSRHEYCCQNSWHDTGVDGDKYITASHNLNSEHQHNDWKWHRDCVDSYNCNREDIQWGYNTATVTFHYGYDQGSTNRSASADSSITSPAGKTITGQTLVGWNKRSTKVEIYHVQQVPGVQLATWNWNTNSPKSVMYDDICPGAKDSRNGYDNAAACWSYNYIRIHYRAGFDQGSGRGLTSDSFAADYIDYKQYLASRAKTEFIRPGYDIITKGWFGGYNPTDGKTNEGTYTHHVNKVGDEVCGDTAKYPFSSHEMSATEWSDRVMNNFITDIYLYPHWRAHVLTVNYDTNGGVDNTGKSGVIEGATWYYDDGKSGAPQKTYYVTNTVPTKAGYVFMGWGNKATWSQERYARQIANEATGIKVAYDNTQAKSVAKTAQDWASYCGKDLAAGDQTVTFYAQWERVITYKFYYYNDEANKAYYYEGGYQDCNTASVAFHNDDDEYLYMDIYMKRCCEAAFSVQKDADSGFFLCKKLSRPSHYRWTIF